MEKILLAQYVDACQLLAEIEAELKSLEKKKHLVVTDKVSASNSEFPYQKTSVMISGSPFTAEDECMEREHLELLQEQKAQVRSLKVKLRQQISGMPPRIQRILTKKYIQGKTWKKVAAEMGRGATEESVRKETERYLKK